MTQSTVIFDRFADDYDHALNQGISISGEDKDFFANGRIVWLSGLLAVQDPALPTFLRSLNRSHYSE